MFFISIMVYCKMEVANLKEVVIIDGLRTPIGKYKGMLKDLSAVELGSAVTKALLTKYPEAKADVSQVIFGNVLQAGTGQNPARQIALKSGLDYAVTAATINEVCGSGMKAVLMARQAIQLGEAEVVLAGGIESMTRAPGVAAFDFDTKTYGAPLASMIIDGLTDAQSGEHMGLTAENVAARYQVSREEQDAFALASQQKAAQARSQGLFKNEILPLQVGEHLLTEDEGIRGDSTLEKLATLRPAFKEGGTVTAGNASTINDGAAALLLASKDYAEAHNLPYLAIVKETVEVGIDPAIMGISPITAIRQLVAKSGISLAEIDLFEINEAFAASSIVVEQELGLPKEKVNIYGGGISLGHAIGATGARLLTTLGHQLQDTDQRYGIASLCIGGGLGMAVLLERPQPTNKAKRFYELTAAERLQKLVADGDITSEVYATFKDTALDSEISSHLIENAISEVEIPLGVAQHLEVNGRKYLVPVATEEPSVIAALSNGAKIAGNFTSQILSRLMRGQIVFYDVADQKALVDWLDEQEAHFFAVAKEAHPSIYQRGGGLREIHSRPVGTAFVSCDFLVDVQEAMGANIVNTILEAVAVEVRSLREEPILFAILSNLTTESLVTTSCRIPVTRLGAKKGAELAAKIATAATYAQLDPYRAATHNKGIMNGVDGILLATGNDTRAQAAAIHAYAASTGQYRGLSQWRVVGDELVGELTLPLAIGTVGGGTRVLPKAQAAMAVLNVSGAAELAQVIASAGLAQNLAALKALVGEGIQRGHMALQARSLAMTVGAKGAEIPELSRQLKKAPHMNEGTAKELLAKIRQV